MRIVHIFAGGLMLLALWGCVHQAAEAPPAFPGGQVAMDVADAAIARADAEGKLALLVLGGNWCHDSDSLVEKFKAPEMAALLDAHYDVALINVEDLSKGFDVARRFGVPTLFHTPTVLIIDPQTENLINARDHFIWRDAYKKTPEETLAYFGAYAAVVAPELRERFDPPVNKLVPIGWSLRADTEFAGSRQYSYLTAEIDAFEARQVARIEAGYDLLRPMFADQNETFDTTWRALAKLRYQVPDDLLALRDELRGRIAAGETNISLTFPAYAPLPWEES